MYIEPGKSSVVRWIFRPLEAKLYTEEVPVMIENGETALIYFEGSPPLVNTFYSIPVTLAFRNGLRQA